jgi:hypothetical protein
MDRACVRDARAAGCRLCGFQSIAFCRQWLFQNASSPLAIMHTIRIKDAGLSVSIVKYNVIKM